MRTAVFDTIKSLQPHFFSLREIGTMTDNPSVSLDIKIPLSWRVDNIVNGVTLKIQDKNEHQKLISFVSSNTKEGYDAVFSMAKKVIKVNQEEEEKIRLFNVKVEELKSLFLNTSLDKLKDISFIKDNVRDKKSIGEIGLGDEKGSGVDGNSQTEND